MENILFANNNHFYNSHKLNNTIRHHNSKF